MRKTLKPAKARKRAKNGVDGQAQRQLGGVDYVATSPFQNLRPAPACENFIVSVQLLSVEKASNRASAYCSGFKATATVEDCNYFRAICSNYRYVWGSETRRH